MFCDCREVIVTLLGGSIITTRMEYGVNMWQKVLGSVCHCQNGDTVSSQEYIHSASISQMVGINSLVGSYSVARAMNGSAPKWSLTFSQPQHSFIPRYLTTPHLHEVKQVPFSAQQPSK